MPSFTAATPTLMGEAPAMPAVANAVTATGGVIVEMAAKYKTNKWAARVGTPSCSRPGATAAAVMIYAADVQGDYREEAITIDETGSVKVFWNENANSNPVKPRYWKQQHYRRQKQNWNYYSP